MTDRHTTGVSTDAATPINPDTDIDTDAVSDAALLPVFLDRVEVLLQQHQDTQAVCLNLREQLSEITAERDALRSKLRAARARIDVLLDKLPVSEA